MDAYWGYEKNPMGGNNSGNSSNGNYQKKIQTEHEEYVVSIPCDLYGQFEPIAVPKHEIRGLFIEKLVISIYAKGMIRKYTKSKLSFPSDYVVKKTVYLSLMEIEKKWTMLISNLSLIMNQFILIFKSRI